MHLPGLRLRAGRGPRGVHRMRRSPGREVAGRELERFVKSFKEEEK